MSLLSNAQAETLLQPDDFVGFSYWIVSIGCMAATAFFFLIVPSELQGTSTKYNSASVFGNDLKSLNDTVVFVTPKRSKFPLRDFILVCLESFAIICPLFCIISAIWVVFEPGAAQQSKILFSSITSFAISGGIIEVNS